MLWSLTDRPRSQSLHHRYANSSPMRRNTHDGRQPHTSSPRVGIKHPSLENSLHVHQNGPPSVRGTRHAREVHRSHPTWCQAHCGRDLWQEKRGTGAPTSQLEGAAHASLPGNWWKASSHGNWDALWWVHWISLLAFVAVVCVIETIVFYLDGCDITWQAMLTRNDEYEGGGTYFRCLRKTVVLKQGQVLVHPGKIFFRRSCF